MTFWGIIDRAGGGGIFPGGIQRFVEKRGAPAALGGGLVVAEIAIDADVEYYNLNGQSESFTVSDIETIMSAVNAQYEAQVGITHQITTIIVRTAEPDPYTTTNPEDLLVEFRDYWNTNHADITRAVAHLFTGKDLVGSIIGIAYVSVVCNDTFAYGLSESKFSANFARRQTLTAHEPGHNWSSSHCDEVGSCTDCCPLGHTMCSSVPAMPSNTFSTCSVDVIDTFRDASTCLADCSFQRFYVDIHASGLDNGNSWANAYNSLHRALENAAACTTVEEIWVAEGTYTPAEGVFQFVQNVAVYGGFPTGGGNWESRNWEDNLTVLSGDLNGDDAPGFQNYSDNRPVLYAQGVDETAVFDGFTITSGNAQSLGGGALRAAYSIGEPHPFPASPTVRNCTFSNNFTTENGGAIYLANFTKLGLINCRFVGNASIGSGGAIYSIGQDAAFPIECVDCVFLDNSAGSLGGAIRSRRAVELANAVFEGNTSSSSGGALYGWIYELENCNFTDNSSGSNAGAIYISMHGSLTDCVFSGNSAGEDGGALWHKGLVPMTGCLFEKNTAHGGLGGGAVYVNHDGCNIMTNCEFRMNVATKGRGGAYFGSAVFAHDCIFEANQADWLGGAAVGGYLHENCEFRGNSAESGGALSSSSVLRNCLFEQNSSSCVGGALTVSFRMNATNVVFLTTRPAAVEQ